ncbi:universal stress protein [Natrinema salsiterrestre]|uniref:Universal stress protein n=1 Tax=Natrinema salsiterrestre TaxID=2950540 RepID=A0A9Q4L8H3_9EURY|nr:universal stress protein [Natrinema salsiterrestre]MDF9748497.1 universal stress protein [Natrinema salsiterrestre]
MTEILLAIDDDETRVERQIRTILDLPIRTETVSVTVLHVFSDNPTGASVSQLQTARSVEERLEAAGIDINLDERSGDPAPEILAYADEIDADVLCLAGRKRSPTGKALFGSVTQDVLLSTDRSVLIAGGAKTDGA